MMGTRVGYRVLMVVAVVTLVWPGWSRGEEKEEIAAKVAELQKKAEALSAELQRKTTELSAELQAVSGLVEQVRVEKDIVTEGLLSAARRLDDGRILIVLYDCQNRQVRVYTISPDQELALRRVLPEGERPPVSLREAQPAEPEPTRAAEAEKRQPPPVEEEQPAAEPDSREKREVADEQNIQAAISLLTHRDPIIRQHARADLEKRGGKTLLLELHKALDVGSPACDTMIDILRKLTAGNHGYSPDASKEERAEAVAKWKKWIADQWLEE